MGNILECRKLSVLKGSWLFALHCGQFAVNQDMIVCSYSLKLTKVVTCH